MQNYTCRSSDLILPPFWICRGRGHGVQSLFYRARSRLRAHVPATELQRQTWRLASD